MKKKRYKNIFEAIAADDIEAVKTFLPKHANDKNKYGNSALVYTIIAENKQMFDLLLDNGADPYAGTDRYPILYWLWIHNWFDKIQIAVDHGLDLNSLECTTNVIITDVCFALSKFTLSKPDSINSNLIFLKELLRCGARTDIPDKDGKLPLDYLPDKVRTEVETYIVNLETERQGNIAHETGFAYDI